MDRRVVRTFAALHVAFTRLLSENRYEEITVAEICKAAVIRRTTFYKHFRDKDDYFQFFATEVSTELLSRGMDDAAAVEGEDAPTMGKREAVLRCATSYMLENKTLMDNIFNSSVSGAMTIAISNATAGVLHDAYSETFGNKLPANFDQACNFTAGGVVRTLRQWLESENPAESKEDFITTTVELIGRAMAPKKRRRQTKVSSLVSQTRRE